MNLLAGLRLVVCLAVLVCLVGALIPTAAQVLPYGLKIEKVIDSTAELAAVAQSPSGDLWVLERTTGVIRVFVAGKEADTVTVLIDPTCDGGLLDIAFDPTNPNRALISYIDAGKKFQVGQVFFEGGTLAHGGFFLTAGTATTGCNTGGGLAIGADNKLYISVGDLDQPGEAQSDASLQGKILRANLDGSIPADNASGTLVWAKGFRAGTDLSIGSTGTVYVADQGFGSAHDELNAVHEGGNHGWDVATGSDPGFDDPLVSYNPVVGMNGVTAVGSKLGFRHTNSILYTCGSPDAACPAKLHTLSEGGDGWVYASTSGANPGIYRVWNDVPGPREVSGPGSPFHLTVDKNGSDLTVGWENLGPLDAYRPWAHYGQHSRPYQVWEGSFPVSAYNQTPVANTPGTADGPNRLTTPVTPGAGSRYYLVSAQADNLECSTGTAADGTARPGPEDFCVGSYGKNVGDCAEVWVDHSAGATDELRLRDYNPHSPTYLQALGMSDFRGKVVHLDLSAINCVFCNSQADVFATIEEDWRDRDVVFVTIMNQNFQTLAPIPTANCAAQILGWVNLHNETNPILCDVDNNGDGDGDVIRQYWHAADCGGTPQNFYIDQGHTIDEFICGGELGAGSITTKLSALANPETCE